MNLLYLTDLVYVLFTPNESENDFCILKKSSLLSFPKLNILAIKENCKEETCGNHSYLRTSFL